MIMQEFGAPSQLSQAPQVKSATGLHFIYVFDVLLKTAIALLCDIRRKAHMALAFLITIELCVKLYHQS